MDFGFPIALLNGIANFAALSMCTSLLFSPRLTSFPIVGLFITIIVPVRKSHFYRC